MGFLDPTKFIHPDSLREMRRATERELDELARKRKGLEERLAEIDTRLAKPNHG
jgi:hypothetical protein